MNNKFESDPLLKHEESSFELLPNNVLSSIFLFLDLKTFFLSILLVKKSLYKFIESHDHFINQLFIRNYGLSAPMNFDIKRLIRKICKKLIVIKEIPFYAYLTDGGFDLNNTDYWINRVFTKGKWNICSREGNNVNIIGALVDNRCELEVCRACLYEINYGLKKKTFWEKITSCFKRRISIEDQNISEIDLVRISHYLILQKDFVRDIIRNGQKNIVKYKRKFNFSNQNIDRYLNDLCKMLIFPSSNLVFESILNVREADIEISQTKTAIITGIEISRKGTFTCPVKTLMVFLSQEGKNLDDNKFKEETKFFEGCNSEEQLIHKLKFLGIKKIYETNSVPLYGFTKNRLPANFFYSYAIFQNKGKNIVKPMIWLKFNTINYPLFSINLNRNNYFIAQKVLLKLIDCEDLRGFYSDLSERTNIDINYVSFSGKILN